MHAAVWRAICNASRHHTRPPCRIIAGCRHPNAARKFHRSAIARQKPADPTKPTDTNEPNDANSNTEGKGVESVTGQAGVAEPLESQIKKYRLQPRIQSRRHRSLLQRASELPSAELPKWFLDQNVILREKVDPPKYLGATWIRDKTDKLTNDYDYKHFIKEARNMLELRDSSHLATAKRAEDIHDLLDAWIEAVQTSKLLLAKHYPSSEFDPARYSGGPYFSGISDWDPLPTAKSLAEIAIKMLDRPFQYQMFIDLVQKPVTVSAEGSPETPESNAEVSRGDSENNDEELKDSVDHDTFRTIMEHDFDKVSTDMRRLQKVVQALHSKNQFIEKIHQYGLEDESVFGKHGRRHQVDLDVYEEVLASLKAGLSLRRPQNLKLKDIHRPVTLLQCPKDGGSYFLDKIVQHAAANLDADLIRISAQDIAQVVDDSMGDNVAWTRSATTLLGYEAQKAAGNLEEWDDIEEEEMEEEDEFDEGTIPKTSDVMHRFYRGATPPGTLGILSLVQGNGFPPKRGEQEHDNDHDQDSSNFQEDPQPALRSEEYTDIQLPAILRKLVDAASTRRAQGEASLDKPLTEPKLIIQLSEYKELNAAPGGAEIMSKLRDLVQKRWGDGRDIIIVGTTSAEDLAPELSLSAINEMQSDGLDTPERTIVVPPPRKMELKFKKDGEDYMTNINVRHVEDMVRKLSGSKALVVAIQEGLPETTQIQMKDSVWAWSHIHRIATTVLGLPDLGDVVDGATFSRAVALLEASDKAKAAWTTNELKKKQMEKLDTQFPKKHSEDADSKKDDNPEVAKQEKLEKLKGTCTKYETRLLSGVIDPSDIKTTFAQVRAPPETIEALKTLTSLSLTRPEAFSYGVLATDKISGLLLYGPPGTGKTMLAKAVAKESGATVLEVSGGDLYDKFVGEGEKLVKALFSLAKKLSPCVVFIDEADAIFGARGGSSARTSHRELINQFLREWDGMNDLSAFIMVATNRPFDLDDAVLRRLPRRVLVDLPLEKDREEILKIHLRGEILDDSVSIQELAKETPFYSGSDLKNLAVAAALACVRDENAHAAQHTGSEPYVYPPKRILTRKHFDKAMEEISASVSEDMDTLTAIRKFDAKFGDRKGRKKKAPGLGFGLQEPEKDSEAARVRQTDT